MKQKNYRLPDDLIEKLERDRKEKKIASENDYATQAFRHFISCKTLDTTGAMKLIVLNYPAKCLKCKEPIQTGEWALWGRGIGAICLDCYVSRIGNKALVALYLKKKTMKRIIKALQEEADRLSVKVEMFSLGEKIEVWGQESRDVHKLIMDFFKTRIGTDKEKETLEEILRVCRKEMQLQREIENFLELGQLKKVKKKKTAGLV